MKDSIVPLAVQPRRYSLRIGRTLFDPNDFNALGVERPAFLKPSAGRVAYAVADALAVEVVLVHHAQWGDHDEEGYRLVNTVVLRDRLVA